MTTNQVDRALAAGGEAVGRELLALAEDQWFDRKSARINPKDLGPALVAFANAEGGTIVIGLHNGEIEGIRANAGKINAFRQAAVDHTNPPVRFGWKQVHCINSKGENDTLIVMNVETAERVHELKNGDCYLRIGDESRRLSFVQRQELEFDKGQSQYDGHVVVGKAMRDVNQKLAENYKQATRATQGLRKLFMARNLLSPNGELTNAGYLLFGSNPQELFPEAYIRVLRFLTTERGTGARLGIDDDSDVRIEGPIPTAIQQASKTIESWVPRRRALGPDGTFEGRPIVPKDAWLEGLVNAVIHRSYSLAGDHIRVEIYPDRIEIESPGRFPGLADPTKPLEISRFARNPRIARVCADLRIGQELGEGIKRMFDEMRAVGLTDPIYRQSGGSVRLVLASVPRLNPRVADRMPAGSQRVLDALRANGDRLGTGDLANLMGMSRPYIAARLKALEAERLVRWSGKSPKDPRAVWILND